MSRGLYTLDDVATYLGVRPQEVARLIAEDGLPALQLPGKARVVRKIALHGLHGWLKGKQSGAAFMGVEELKMEVDAALAGKAVDPCLVLKARVAADVFYEALVGRLNAGEVAA